MNLEVIPFTFDIQSPEIEQAYIVLKDRSNFQKAFEKSKGIFIVEENFSKSLLIDGTQKPIIQISKEAYNKLEDANGQIMMNISVGVGDTIYRGAIDNASGVAVLLEIAKALGSSTEKYDSDIIIVAFNGEDSGLQGSSHFVEELSSKYTSIYNINLDSLYNAPISIVSWEDEVSEDSLDDLIAVLKDRSLEFNTGIPLILFGLLCFLNKSSCTPALRKY